MLNVILPSKIVVDIHPLKVDFSPFLEAGEEIEDVVVTVSMYTGEDPAPDNLLYLPPEFTPGSGVVWQRIKAGIPGNIYLITITITTDLGHDLVATAYQAVLPNGVPADDIFVPFPLTSKPYPLNTIDGIESGSIVDGLISWQVIPEAFDSFFDIVSGTLRSPLITYDDWPPEAFDHTSDIVSGTLRTVLITYSDWPPEAVDHAASIQAGTLRAALIAYTYYAPEAVDHSCSIIGGSLV